MATLTVQQVSRSGLAETYAAAAAGGDEFVNDGRTFFRVVNGLVDCNVTIATQKTVDGKAVADDTITVSASTNQMIGPFPPSIYNDSDGKVQVTYDDESNVTVAAIRVP